MSKTPPTSPDEPEVELTIQQQLDELLVAIEKQEPGTLDPKVLPDAYRKQIEGEKAPEPEPAEQATAPPPPAQESEADVQDEINALLDSAMDSPTEPEASAELDPKPEAQPTASEQTPQDEVAEALADFEEALDSSPTAEETSATPEPEPTPAPKAPEKPASPEKAKNSPAEEDMLAALNQALKDMEPDELASFGPPKQKTEPPSEPDPKPTEQTTALEPASKSEADLQAEINALLNNPAGPEPAAKSTNADTTSAAENAEQDRIADEIEDLLNQNEDPAQQEEAPTIDDIDQMLAKEIDIDDELDDDLLGDFQSVDDVTAGIQTETPEPEPAIADPGGATASDVADELDSQPENQPVAEESEDPLEALSKIAEVVDKNQAEDEALAATQITLPAWFTKLRRAGDRLLRTCFMINWPARRFLTAEWRANLGYLALIHLFIGVAMWFYLIIR